MGANCKFCNKYIEYLEEEHYQGFAEDVTNCAICDKLVCRECSEDEMIYDDYSDVHICKGECETEYNKTRTWEFVTERGEEILIDTGDSINGGKLVSIDMSLGMFTLADLDNFIKLLLKVRRIQK